MINRLWIIIFLLIIWCGFSNNWQFPNILFGLILASSVNYVILPKKIHFSFNVIKFIIPVIVVIHELIIASVEVAMHVLFPSKKNKSEIIKIPLLCKHPVQITLLANFISLTPGTLVLDLEENNTVLVVHIMFSQNKDKIISFVKNYLEPKIMEAIKSDRALQ